MIYSIYLSIAPDGRRIAMGGRPGYANLRASQLPRCPRLELHLFDSPEAARRFADLAGQLPEEDRPRVAVDPGYFPLCKTAAVLAVWPGQAWPEVPTSFEQVVADHRSDGALPIRLNDVLLGLEAPLPRPTQEGAQREHGAEDEAARLL